jgi:hypothetical protein
MCRQQIEHRTWRSEKTAQWVKKERDWERTKYNELSAILRRTFLLGLVVAILCIIGLLTSAIRLFPRLMAIENGCKGRKYIGYVLAVLWETPTEGVPEHSERVASTSESGV